MKTIKKLIGSALLCLCACSVNAQNPYLPLWEHIPDGEPRVFEDPVAPGKYRAYIIGSHDTSFREYCGADVHMWSAPVEDLSAWVDEGPIFTYYINNQWDIMYAPDLVEVKENGKKVYYLYPHVHNGGSRINFVAKSDRPDGPFTVLNASPDGTAALAGSIVNFDPSIFIDEITDPKDKDYNIGYRAYAFWGFMHSTACELDQKTMYSMRPGTELRDYFIPASRRYGELNDPAGTQYPALYQGQNPGDFNFFEASSIRKVGNKYVMVFSGYSGPEYGQGSTNSALRYAFGDSPLGPWRSGGVLVDSRGVVTSPDGASLITTNAAHNTHGSLQQINGQWYVFYHRPPRGFGNARQTMVAPVKIEWDEKPVAEGGQVVIRGYDPYAADETWTAKAKDGNEYTGAEVTSEGFQIYGLNPYDYYSAGYACYMSDPGMMQDTWDWWDNSMDLTDIKNQAVVGFKYFGFGGLSEKAKGVNPFEGAKKGNKTAINLYLTPRTEKAFKIHVWIDGPAKTAKGKEIAVIKVPAASDSVSTRFTANVAKAVEGLKGKHAIYLVAEGAADEALFNLHGIAFSKNGVAVERPVPPTIKIQIDGKDIELPKTPVRFSHQNGYVYPDHYDVDLEIAQNSTLTATAEGPDAEKVQIEITRTNDRKAFVKTTYNGKMKMYTIQKAPEMPQGFGPFGPNGPRRSGRPAGAPAGARPADAR